MCNPVACPACSRTTLHKGTCENPDCGYDPRASRWEPPGPVDPPSFASDAFYCDLAVYIVKAPFPCIRVETGNYANLDEFLELCGYRGDIFTREPHDLFDSPTQYGFDLTHDMAKPYLPFLNELLAPRG